MDNGEKLSIVLVAGQHMIGYVCGDIMRNPLALIPNQKGQLQFLKLIGDPGFVQIGNYQIAWQVDEQSELGKMYFRQMTGIQIATTIPANLKPGVN